jgi:hypothetical protein
VLLVAQGLPGGCLFAYTSPAEVMSDRCVRCDITKTMLTEKYPQQNGKGFLGVAPACFLPHPLSLSVSQMRSMKLRIPVESSQT